jgi:hypothetical protein
MKQRATIPDMRDHGSCHMIIEDNSSLSETLRHCAHQQNTEEYSLHMYLGAAQTILAARPDVNH